MVIVYRMKSSDFSVIESAGKTFKKSSKTFPNAVKTARLYKANKKLKLIQDTKNPKFLRGAFSKGKPIGTRTNILPNGEKLDKAFSLFAPDLAIHNENSAGHWDVIFQNPSGKFAYLYTLDKKKLSKKQKYSRVRRFSKVLPKLKRNLTKALGHDQIALPMQILLKTRMRIGNEMYYNKNGHKGLTTLKKHDVKISGSKVTFSYIAKDGVPQKTTETFSKKLVNELKKLLKRKKKKEFIFTSASSHPLKDVVFENAFEKYSGQRFYPHIVRSHYATQAAKDFLKKNKKPTKSQVKDLYNKIAEELGHKKFSKKNNDWETSYQVTLHHYIQPEIVEKIAKITI